MLEEPLIVVLDASVELHQVGMKVVGMGLGVDGIEVDAASAEEGLEVA